MALSLVLGLIGGAGIGAFQEFRERFFRTGDDVRDALNLNFLGYLPIIGGSALRNQGESQRRRKRLPRATTDAGHSSASCAWRSTRRRRPSPRRCATLKLASDVVLQGKAMQGHRLRFGAAA